MTGDDQDAYPDDDLDPRVASALARLEAAEADGTVSAGTADTAEAAWRSFAGDAPSDALLQHRLQEFLWYALPRKWLTDLAGHEDIAESLACLLDELDRPEYAEICRSATTHEILTAWDRDDSEGFAAFRRALDRSGVDPPDVAELAWGSIMTIDEALARDHVAARLEHAIAGKRFEPGGRGWRIAQRAAASEALTDPVPNHPSAPTRLQAVLTARIESWVERDRAGRTRWELIRGIEPALLHPVDPPPTASTVVGPMRWLLEHASDDGLPLTDRGNLTQRVVREACAEFDWAPLGRGTVAQSQLDIVELLVWDELLREAGLVRRRHRKLLATPRGRDALASDEASWRALAAALAAADGWDGFAQESAMLALLAAEEDEATPRGEIDATVVELADAGGWRERETGTPPDPDTVRYSVGPFLRTLKVLDLVDERARPGEPLGGTFITFQPGGRETLVEAVRTRATAPHHSFWG